MKADEIRDRIINREIEPISGVSVAELDMWLTGYAKCQLDILNILEELEEGE